MRIDLREIPAYVISVNPVRAEHVKKQLAAVGITPTIVDGVRCSPAIIGCGLSHLAVLLYQITSVPFLVLEDDAAVTEDFQPVIDVPEVAHGAYLGVSTWGVAVGPNGVSKQAFTNSSRASEFDETWLRVHNMCSSHAILYTSENFVESAKSSHIECLTRGIAFDVGLARLQTPLVMLTPIKPFFYQDARVGGNEADTRQPLTPTEVLVR